MIGCGLAKPLTGTLLLVATFGLANPAWSGDATRVRDVVYGRKHGMALTMDVLKPAKPTGVGVIFLVSGGFESDKAKIESADFPYVDFDPMLQLGHTVFLACHSSQPKYVAHEIVPDIHRAVRFIRTHASDYGVHTERLGIMGMSSGGLLSLMIGATGKPGDPQAADPVDRASSRVQAVACFCPPSDLTNFGAPGRLFVEHEPVKFVAHVFGLQGEPRQQQVDALRALSPIEHLSRDMPPTLILHGDADSLVPFEQSERLAARLAELQVAHELVRRPGAWHVWPEMAKDHQLVADWFEKHLASPSGEAE